jgi:hypothetical protein
MADVMLSAQDQMAFVSISFLRECCPEWQLEKSQRLTCGLSVGSGNSGTTGDGPDEWDMWSCDDCGGVANVYQDVHESFSWAG